MAYPVIEQADPAMPDGRPDLRRAAAAIIRQLRDARRPIAAGELIQEVGREVSLDPHVVAEAVWQLLYDGVIELNDARQLVS